MPFEASPPGIGARSFQRLQALGSRLRARAVLGKSQLGCQTCLFVECVSLSRAEKTQECVRGNGPSNWRGAHPRLVMAGPLSRPSMNTASGDEHHVQVVPMRIVAFDQIDLPVAFILLERLLAPDRRDHALTVLPGARSLRLLVTPMVSVPCFLLLIMETAMNESRGTMTQTVFMDGRDNGPAMTNLL